MITTEAITNATLPNPASRVQRLPAEYEGIKAVRMDNHDDTNVTTKPHLMAQWFAKPTGMHSGYADLEYKKAERRGWRKAKEEDIVACLVDFDHDHNAFFYGDMILMVAPRELVLGYRLDAFQRANARVGMTFQDASAQAKKLGAQNAAAGGENGIRITPETQISLQQTQVGVKPTK